MVLGLLLTHLLFGERNSMKATEFIPEQEVTEYKDHDTLRGVKEIIKKAGYKSLGSGVDAMVYGKKNGDVVKILIGERGRNVERAAGGFLAYVKFILKHQDITHFPRVKKIQTITVGHEELYKITMERLYPLSKMESDAYEWMEGCLPDNFKSMLNDINSEINYEGHTPNKYYIRIKNIISQQQSIYNLMIKLDAYASSNKQINTDMHSGNVMKRKDGTWIITDPFISQYW